MKRATPVQTAQWLLHHTGVFGRGLKPLYDLTDEPHRPNLAHTMSLFLLLTT